MKKLILGILVITVLLFVTSCSKKDDDTGKTANLTLNIQGLQDLGSNYKYEGWIISNGKAVTSGVFSVNQNGKMNKNSFTLDKQILDNATKFILTIEPYPDSDPAPSSTHILAGNFSNKSANLSIGAPEAFGDNFTTSTGKYVLATPSDGPNNNEKSGVWFLGSLPPSAGLNLPTLPQGWNYEGWVVINGKPISTGIFTDIAAADNFAAFSESMGTPPFPGEDFLKNAPNGVNFPTDLSGAKVVISIEPYPDNSPSPFVLKPLLGDVPGNVENHKVYNMNNIISNTAPTGIATK